MHSIHNANETSADHLNHLDDEHAFGNIAAMLFLGILMIVGVVGNCLVFLVYLVKIKPSATRCFILALTILDLITCSICIPIDIVKLRYNFTFQTSLMIPCKLTPLVTFTAFATGSVLICVATERFKKICLSGIQQITIKTAKIAVSLACIAAAIGSIPAMILYGGHTELRKEGNVEANTTLCGTLSIYGTVFPQLNSAFQFVVFVTATATLAILYFLIWKTVTRFAKNKPLPAGNTTPKETVSSDTKEEGKRIESECSRSDNTSDNDSSSGKIQPASFIVAAKRRQSMRQFAVRRTTLMMFVITFMCILSFLPHLSLKVAGLVYMEKFENLTGPVFAFYHVFYRSYFINFAVNPFIYSYYDMHVRKGIKALFNFKLCRQ